MTSLTLYDALTTFTATAGLTSLTYLFFSYPVSSSVMDLLSLKKKKTSCYYPSPAD